MSHFILFKLLNSSLKMLFIQLKRLKADSYDDRKVTEERIRREMEGLKVVEDYNWSDSGASRCHEGGLGSGGRRDREYDGDSEGTRGGDGDRDGGKDDLKDSTCNNFNGRGDEQKSANRGPSQEDRDKRLQAEIRQLQLETVSQSYTP